MQPIEKEAYLLTGDQKTKSIFRPRSNTGWPIRSGFCMAWKSRTGWCANHTISVLVEFIGRNKVDEVYTFLRAEIEQGGHSNAPGHSGGAEDRQSSFWAWYLVMFTPRPKVQGLKGVLQGGWGLGVRGGREGGETLPVPPAARGPLAFHERCPRAGGQADL